MADYYTNFSCVLDVGSAENATRALAIFKELEAELDREQNLAIGFAVAVEHDQPSQIWIFDEGGFGDVENVIAYVFCCAEEFDLSGRWGFVWSLNCSRPLLDGYGGGAQLLDLGTRTSLAWLDCNTWLFALLEPDADPAIGVVCS
jgi:hypothetical protein